MAKTRYQEAVEQLQRLGEPYLRIATCTMRGVTVTIHYATTKYFLYSASDTSTPLLFARICVSPHCPVAWFWHRTPDGRRIKFPISDFTLCKDEYIPEELPDYHEPTT